ncbi:MAG: DUF1501 domain-containing protein [Pirellulaceae bacterium]
MRTAPQHCATDASCDADSHDDALDEESRVGGVLRRRGHAPPSDDQRLRDSLDLYPAYGSVVDKLLPGDSQMPSFVAYPHVIRDGSIVPGQHASFLGKGHDPLLFLEDPNDPNFRLPELSLPSGLSIDRLHRRRSMQQLVDQQVRLMEHSGEARGFDSYYERAIGMLTTDRGSQRFDLSAEPEPVRDRYGRTSYGQSCLLARGGWSNQASSS